MEQMKANTLSTIPLGRQGENLARQIVFDVSGWESEYGAGSVELIAQRPGDETPYPVVTARDGDSVVWTVTSADTLYPGDSGRCELRYYVGETLAKSRIWGTYVARAMDTPSETTPPEPEQGWVDQVLSVDASAKASADAAKADADRAAQLADEVAQNADKTAQEAIGAEQAKEAAETARDRAETAAIKQPYPNAETGTWWVWNAAAAAYVDSGAPIADQPRVVEVSGAELALALTNNTEVHCTDPVTALAIDGFAAGNEGRVEQWGIVFTASAGGITVTVPDTLIWAVAEPVFTAGSTYWLSVVPLGDKYLAAWTEVSADGQASA